MKDQTFKKRWGPPNRETIIRQFEKDQTELLSFCRESW